MTKTIRSFIYNSKEWKKDSLVSKVLGGLGFLSLSINVGGQSLNSKSILEMFNVPEFVQNLLVGFGVLLLVASFFFMLKKREKGSIHFNDSNIVINGKTYSVKDLNQLKITFSSITPIYGERDLGKGGGNYIDFEIAQTSFKYEFYIKSQKQQKELEELIQKWSF